jgi:hypothetical protein
MGLSAFVTYCRLKSLWKMGITTKIDFYLTNFFIPNVCVRLNSDTSSGNQVGLLGICTHLPWDMAQGNAATANLLHFIRYIDMAYFNII